MADFAESIAAAYAVDGLAVDLGRGVHDGERRAGRRSSTCRWA